MRLFTVWRMTGPASVPAASRARSLFRAPWIDSESWRLGKGAVRDN